MPHEPFADLVAGVEDVDGHQLGLGFVGAAVPEHLPHRFGRGIELDLVMVFLHTGQRTTRRDPAATVARVTMKLPIIDADGHVMEPFDLWDDRLAEEYRDRAWKRIKTADGEHVSFLGHATGFEWSVGSLCTPGALSANGRLDRDLDTEVDRGASDPVRRIELMDEQGVGVSVLFPTMTLGLDDIPGAGFRAADARAYNSWIADFCGHDPIRLRFASVLPLVDVPWALAEIERAVDDGATTVMLSPIPTPDGRDLGSTDFDPVWSALVEAGLPAVVHASNPASPALGMRHLWRNRAQWQMGVPFQLQLAAMYVIDGRVLVRHPDLHVGFFEGDVGWCCHTGSAASTRPITRWPSWRRLRSAARSSSSWRSA